MFPRSCEIPSVNGAPSRPPHQRNKILKKRNFGKSCDFEQATTTSRQYDFIKQSEFIINLEILIDSFWTAPDIKGR
jgi:hypothetical protein